MAQIAWIMPTARVLNNENDRMVLDTPLTQIVLDIVPNNFTFDIAFGIIDLDVSKQNDLNIVIENISTDIPKKILDSTLSIERNIAYKSDNVNEKDKYIEFESSIILNNFKFPLEGIHRITLTIENNSMHSYFKVITRGIE
ncbi:hypothetical protein [Staphylococcus haemolyticus]|uniref:hypothetical protein n=1 Tax=Staphylococcus haemolyticus TaxID=1283 RepID=UPI001A8E53AE|nr:hypothetical protein [Staphylococcus haemolyticus]MBO0385602.1 hypothetical protein [Staphylococcus haemolyticus]